LHMLPPGNRYGIDIPTLESVSSHSGEPVISFETEVRGHTMIWNDGNAESFPVFTVVADSPAGFSVSIGGRRVTYPWPTYKNVPIEVDMAGAIRVAGQDQTYRVGERGWASVEPQSIETPEFRFLAGGTGWATVAFRDTYI